eukprot:scaffold5546_cov65-Phaeocystis_antarctica.AAC.2
MEGGPLQSCIQEVGPLQLRPAEVGPLQLRLTCRRRHADLGCQPLSSRVDQTPSKHTQALPGFGYTQWGRSPSPPRSPRPRTRTPRPRGTSGPRSPGPHRTCIRRRAGSARSGGMPPWAARALMSQVRQCCPPHPPFLPLGSAGGTHDALCRRSLGINS